MNGPFFSPAPKVTLVKSFGSDAFDNAVATARTCYNSRLITAEDVRRDESSRALRDRIALETYQAGHHTTLQHAHFQFTIENISRQALWSFFHSHPFYNSEQVSQRYVEVKPGNVLIPALSDTSTAVYRSAVEASMAAYRRLIELLNPSVSEAYFSVFPARRRTPEKWGLAVKKRCQELARYILPIGTFAHLYHTVSGLTLHRYQRLSQQLDVPSEVRFVVEAMVSEVNRVDPQFLKFSEDPLPLEKTLEYELLQSLQRSEKLGSPDFLREFDEGLEGKISKLVEHSRQGPSSMAQAVRNVLGLPRAALGDAEALAWVLSPQKNNYLSGALVLSTQGKLTRALHHLHYSFQKKLSHTADSQDQRHRMTPGSRPVLQTHFVPGKVDAILPPLIEAAPKARELYESTLALQWKAIDRLLNDGVAPEQALYLLPNAFPIRYLESGDLMHFHHKWVHRLCYTAQEEIWRASQEEVLQVRKVHPELGPFLQPPCTLRKEAGVTPFCPEGPRFCGVPVWKKDVPEFSRSI